MIELKRFMRRHRLTQDQAGQVLGYSRHFMSSIAQGRRETPEPMQALLLAIDMMGDQAPAFIDRRLSKA